jgi:hypothetical protein
MQFLCKMKKNPMVAVGKGDDAMTKRDVDLKKSRQQTGSSRLVTTSTSGRQVTNCKLTFLLNVVSFLFNSSTSGRLYISPFPSIRFDVRLSLSY